MAITARELDAFMRALPLERWLTSHAHLISPWKFDAVTIAQRNREMLQRRWPAPDPATPSPTPFEPK